MFELNFLKSVKTGDGTKQFSGDELSTECAGVFTKACGYLNIINNITNFHYIDTVGIRTVYVHVCKTWSILIFGGTGRKGLVQ